MGRKCKCQLTGEYGTTDTFYKAENGRYYKSQKLYETWKKQNENRKAVVERFAVDFLDYKTGQVFPTILTKKLKELEFYGYDVINRTINKSYEAIQRALRTKTFFNDVNKIAYIFAIIKNNINDVYKEVQREEKKIETTLKEPEHIFNDVDLENVQTHHKEKDIKKWLEEDDWL